MGTLLKVAISLFVLLVGSTAVFAGGNHESYLGSFVAAECGEIVTITNNHSIRTGTNVELRSSAGVIVIPDVEAYENKVTTGEVPSSWSGLTVNVVAVGKNSVRWSDVAIECPPEKPEIPEVVHEERDPAGGLVCVTYTGFELLPARYAQYWDASETWVSWDGWVLSTYKNEVGLWELSLYAHRGAETTGRFLVSYESGQKTIEVDVETAGGNCVIVENDIDEDKDLDKDDVCPDCPPAQCLLQPGNFVKVANQWVGLTTDSTPLVFATETEAEASGLAAAGYECGLCAEYLVRGNTVFITEGSTAYDIAVALNISEGSPAPNYLNRHMEEALTALRNWQNAGKVDGWHSID